MKSPLRYPGAKGRSAKYITPYFKDEQEICSPFFGGGGVELALISQGKRVYGYDVSMHLVNFWQQLLTNKQELYDIVYAYWYAFHHDSEVGKEEYYALKNDCINSGFTVDTAAKFFVVNRISFSGLTLRGGWSNYNVKMEFGPKIIERLRDFEAPNLSVEHDAFWESIPRHSDIALYCDPPYYKVDGLYGKDKEDDYFAHKYLRDLLVGRGKWVLSYDNCEEVKELYKGFKYTLPQWKYSMGPGGGKLSKEILIFSDDIGENNGDNRL